MKLNNSKDLSFVLRYNLLSLTESFPINLFSVTFDDLDFISIPLLPILALNKKERRAPLAGHSRED